MVISRSSAKSLKLSVAFHELFTWSVCEVQLRYTIQQENRRCTPRTMGQLRLSSSFILLYFLPFLGLFLYLFPHILSTSQLFPSFSRARNARLELVARHSILFRTLASHPSRGLLPAVNIKSPTALAEIPLISVMFFTISTARASFTILQQWLFSLTSSFFSRIKKKFWL